MPKISVVVPMYNTEQHVMQCLKSIEAQTYRDYEVIIINDGSTDNSARVVEGFIAERNLQNYVIINRKNAGPSSARNAGLDYASGEWVTFIDSDDWVEPHFLQSLVDAYSIHPDIDLCIAGYRAYDMDTDSYEIWSNYSCEYAEMPEGLSALQSFGFVWGRMYRRSVIEEYCVRFDERILYCEDNAFHLDINRRISRFCQVNEIVYNYRINRVGSLTTKLIHPRIKYYLYEHAERFCDSIEERYLLEALQRNVSFSQVMWNGLSTSVINNILDNHFSKAYKLLKTPMARSVVRAYKPRTKKDKTFSSSGMCLFVV